MKPLKLRDVLINAMAQVFIQMNLKGQYIQPVIKKDSISGWWKYNGKGRLHLWDYF